MKTKLLIFNLILLLTFTFFAWINSTSSTKNLDEEIPVVAKSEFKAIEVAHRENTEDVLAKILKDKPISPVAKLKVEPKPEVSYSGGEAVVPNNGSVIPFETLRFRGVVYANGYKYTYYSQRVLPGPGLRIPGRHVNQYGYVADKDGYIVLASNYSVPMGATFNTPFGAGKVYDRCANCPVKHLDVYTK